jgi:anthranilate synthase / indole-3-glycerol phosphate synthase / phosphoribosylanthranilate isomerase
LIGVNNRDLRTFKVDLNTTVRIADAIRARGTVVGRDGVSLLALSGIHVRADVIKFLECGAAGILVGESLMKSGDVSVQIAKLMGTRRRSSDGGHAFPQPLAKICGVTSVEYAQAAMRSGANMIGLILVDGSPRCLTIDQAKEIASAVRAYGERTGPILPDSLRASRVEPSLKTIEWYQRNALALRDASTRTPLVVGVFADKTAAEINAIASEIGLDIVQLHGNEGFEICAEIEFPTVRVYHLPDHVNSDSVDAEGILQSLKPGLANFLLLDTSVKGQQGGTGVTFDWKIAAIFSQARLPCIMAGGLTPENVAKAIAIARPLGVDVSSGVEVKGSPGVKDLDKVASFLKTVHDHLAIATVKIDEEVDN